MEGSFCLDEPLTVSGFGNAGFLLRDDGSEEREERSSREGEGDGWAWLGVAASEERRREGRRGARKGGAGTC